MPKARGKVVVRTLLLVGEGGAEKAFLEHLKSIYCPRGSGVFVTVRDAHGKGPEQVVEQTIRWLQNADFDHRATLLDTDLAWPERTRKRARQKRLELVGSAPCLEGLLLRILGRPVPSSSDGCKRALGAELSGRATAPESYRTLFPSSLLEERRRDIPELARLIALLSGNWD